MVNTYLVGNLQEVGVMLMMEVLRLLMVERLE